MGTGGLITGSTKPNYATKTLLLVPPLSTTNPTYVELGLHMGLHSKKPVANRLRHGTASLLENNQIILRRLNL
jgi:hypothetical protein